MEKEIRNIFDNDSGISLNEYDVDKALDKKIFILKDDFPKIDIGETDDSIPKLYDKSLEHLDNDNILLTKSRSENMGNIEKEIFSTEGYLDIKSIEDMNLIRKNVEEYIPIENDLIENNNFNKKSEFNVVSDIDVPEIDDSDYIDDPDYSTDKNMYGNEEVIQLSGNELDIITNSSNTIKYDERYHELEEAVRYEEAFKESDDTLDIDEETWVYKNKKYPRKKFVFEWEFKKIPPILSYNPEDNINDDSLTKPEDISEYNRLISEEIVPVDEDTLKDLESEEESIIVDDEAPESLGGTLEEDNEEAITVDEDTLKDLESEEESIIVDDETLESLDSTLEEDNEEAITVDEDTLKDLESQEESIIVDDEALESLDGTLEEDNEEAITVGEDIPKDLENEDHIKDFESENLTEIVENNAIDNFEQIIPVDGNEQIKDSDLKKLENVTSSENDIESEEGDELITIYSKRKNKQNDKKNQKHMKSIESFEAKDDLLNEESPVAEEKELESVADAQSAIDNEFTLEDTISVDIDIKQNNTPNYNDNEDFDGEITQADLDKAIKLYESEGDEDKNVNISMIKSNALLSDEDRDKFQKLFLYFKSIVERLPEDNLHEFSKTEFYDAYSSLFRKLEE